MARQGLPIQDLLPNTLDMAERVAVRSGSAAAWERFIRENKRAFCLIAAGDESGQPASKITFSSVKREVKSILTWMKLILLDNPRYSNFQFVVRGRNGSTITMLGPKHAGAYTVGGITLDGKLMYELVLAIPSLAILAQLELGLVDYPGCREIHITYFG